jgi:hypothetical protein
MTQGKQTQEEKLTKSGPARGLIAAPREASQNSPANAIAKADFPKADFPNVDRLIDLASSPQPAPVIALQSAAANPKQEARNPKDHPMRKLLLQLTPLLPYLARLLPLLDINIGSAPNPTLSNEVRQAAARIHAIQREMDIAAQDQAVQLKRLEEELARLHAVSEKHAAAQAKLVDTLDSIGRLVRLSAAGLGILLAVLIVMTAVLLARASH